MAQAASCWGWVGQSQAGEVPNTSGRSILNTCRRASGIPLILHSDTDAGFISGINILATTDVPPRSSIIWESFFMEHILGIPNYTSQGTPNYLNARLAYMTTWHDRLKFAREQIGVRPIDVAKEVGVSSATVSDWESGEIKKLEGENLLKVCEFLNISPRWLIFNKGEMTEISLSNDDLHALKINRALGSRERKAWYRAGDSLAEPDGDDGETPKHATQ